MSKKFKPLGLFYLKSFVEAHFDEKDMYQRPNILNLKIKIFVNYKTLNKPKLCKVFLIWAYFYLLKLDPNHGD